MAIRNTKAQTTARQEIGTLDTLLYSVKRVVIDTDFRFPTHYHSVLECIWYPDGLRGYTSVDREPIAAAGEDFLSIPPRVAHSFALSTDIRRPCIVVWIHVENLFRLLEGFHGVTEQLLRDKLTRIPIRHTATAEKLGAGLRELRGYKSLLALTEHSINPAYPLYDADPVADSLDDIRIILSVVGELLAASGGTGSARNELPESVRRALDMLEHSSTENIALDNLARHCGASKYHLCRLFKNHTGHTIVDHITHVRLNRAMSLLRTGGRNISEVAYACGFNSLQFFSRTFKKHTGMSPRKWRESTARRG